MVDKKRIKDYLIENIGESRYLHSIRVKETAEKLAEIYNCDQEKASIAGLLHDCGKLKDESHLLKMCYEFGIILNGEFEGNSSLLHGALGAEIAKRVFSIEDEDILSSIKYHTTGKQNMTILEKIIYIADYIEPKRSFPGIDDIRNLAFRDLDATLLKIMDNTIKYIIDNGWIIHCDTINARNYLVSKKK